MNKIIRGPKWVKRANSWCVTIISEIKNKKSQSATWHSTKEEAEIFIKEQEKNEKK